MSNQVSKGDAKSNGLRLSESNIEACIADNPDLASYVDRLKALDRNHDNELSLDEGKGNEGQDQI